MSSGFRVPDVGLWVGSDHEIFGRPRRVPVRRRISGEALESWRALTVGDHVVHVDHGIGRYEGLVKLRVNGFVAKPFDPNELAERALGTIRQAGVR